MRTCESTIQPQQMLLQQPQWPRTTTTTTATSDGTMNPTITTGTTMNKCHDRQAGRRCSRLVLLRSAAAATVAVSVWCASPVVTMALPMSAPSVSSSQRMMKPEVFRTSALASSDRVRLPPVTSQRLLRQKENIEQLEKLLQVEMMNVEPSTSSHRSSATSSSSTKVKMAARMTAAVTTSPQPKLDSKTSLNSSSTSSSSPSSTSRLVSSTARLQRRRRKQLAAAVADKKKEEDDDDDMDATMMEIPAYWLREMPATKESSALLTREEEVLLTTRIRSLRNAEQVRDEFLATMCSSSSSMTTTDDEEDLCMAQFTEEDWANACGMTSARELRRIIRQGQQARSHLVQANLGLVTSIAKKHHASLKEALEAGNGVGTILTLQDCLQEGQIGLIKAAERFDPAKNVRFSTYATWWIRQRICGAIQDTSRIIRLPAYVHTMLIKIKRAKKQMQREIGREPSVPELAHYMELPVDKLQQYTNAALNVVSIENPLRSGHSGKMDARDARTLADTLASDAPTPLEDAQRESLRRDLHQVLLDHLTETERGVLVARYGLHDGNPKTLEETARIVGVSRDCVRLVEAKALNKLRSPQKNHSLQTYVNGGGPKPKVTTTTTTTTNRKTMLSPLSSSLHHHKKNRSVEETRISKDAKKSKSPFLSHVEFSTSSQRSKMKFVTVSSGQESGLNHEYGGVDSRRAGRRNGEQTLVTSSLEEASSVHAPDRLWFF